MGVDGDFIGIYFTWDSYVIERLPEGVDGDSKPRGKYGDLLWDLKLIYDGEGPILQL